MTELHSSFFLIIINFFSGGLLFPFGDLGRDKFASFLLFSSLPLPPLALSIFSSSFLFLFFKDSSQIPSISFRGTHQLILIWAKSSGGSERKIEREEILRKSGRLCFILPEQTLFAQVGCFRFLSGN